MSSPAQGYNIPLETTTALETIPKPQEIIAEITNEARAVNEPFFASDISPIGIDPNQAVSFFLTIAISTTSKLEVTLDGQVTWLALNQGSTLQSDSLFLFVVPVKESDLFNIRASKATTVHLGRVGQFVQI